MMYAINKHDYKNNTELCLGIITSEKKAKAFCDAKNKIANNINILYYYSKLYKICDSEINDVCKTANKL